MTPQRPPAAVARVAALDDRAIRHEVHRLEGWYFASSRDDGPAHIVDTPYSTLCGSNFYTRAYRRATNMCGRCRRIFKSRRAKGELA